MNWLRLLMKPKSIPTLLVLSLASRCLASQIERQDSSSSRRIRCHVAIGTALTNLSYPDASSPDKPLVFIHADLFLIKPINQRLSTAFGIAYAPVGYQYQINLNQGQTNFIKGRLFYSNVQAQLHYRTSKPLHRVETTVLGGVFGGRLWQDDILTVVMPDNQHFSRRSISTYRLWNMGVCLGIASSISMNTANTMGLKLIYDVGLSNIFTEEASLTTGVKRYTRSITLSTYFTF